MADASAVISGRNFLVYSAPHHAENEIPDNTVGYGSPWGTVEDMPVAWSNRGYTSGGLTFNAALERGEIRVDQEFDPILTPVTSRSITLGTNLAEITAENLNLASGMGTVETEVPTESTKGHNELVIDSSITDQYSSWGFDIRQANAEPFRVVVYKGVPTGAPNINFSADDAALIALEVTALVDTDTSPARIALVRDIVPAL